MSLDECMTKHTHRQYLAWLAWLDDQWNKPDRRDHYLMQIACEVRRGYVKKASAVKFDQFKIPFKFEKQEVSKPAASSSSGTPDSSLSLRSQASAISKSVWLGRMTLPVREVKQ